ncbi:MAG TPA: UbiH/UbiF/VisC/COQ6 family ubiquinone biosynthesis hydroxylase [Hypericibacter adhaerens]|uniref:UbiH/UbiF/VisC/COQ6 family ubiquinone biosynthesis hydroxylase n=1 Tax=Hypericibacter adhaerens TaxID=2602016 RepID=UPI002C95EE2B|nr:UbiH/UbiF/VisC/COQ6 family ubiquinone biosynthesis hydroxylase [Hypericibacter adhaerens]HWA42025.1 UbiH/UbiF/VisC/COQ6 family ubiquinone biosynthesis hydroxylase [Hypericibacter adhaerens]
MMDPANQHGAASRADPGPGHASRPDADLLIAGGGLVGLTLALALADAGLSVIVIDSLPAAEREAVGYDGRSSAIAEGSRRVLDGVGVWNRMAPEACPILDIRVSDARVGQPASWLFLHYDHRELGSATTGRQRGPASARPAPMGYIVENRAIRRALLAAVAARPGIRHLAPAQAQGLVREPGRVRVTLADGGSLTGRLAVAADGRGSPMRQAAGIRLTEWDYPQSGIVCTIGHELSHENVAHEHFLPSGPFAVLPMVDDENGHRSSIVWTEKRELVPAIMALSPERFAAEIQHRFGDSLGRIRLLGGRWAYPLRLQHAARYVGERLALVGDAAHAIHPIAGQGLNLGLRDVAALAETLVDAHRLGLDIGLGEPLERYERWRRFDNLMLMAATDILNRLFSNDLPPVRLARDVGLGIVNRVPPLKRLFMRHAMGLVGDLPRLIRGERL